MQGRTPLSWSTLCHRRGKWGVAVGGEMAGRHSPRHRRGWLLELSGAGGAWWDILTMGRREFLQLLVLLAYVLGQRAPCLAAVLQVLAHSCWAALLK